MIRMRHLASLLGVLCVAIAAACSDVLTPAAPEGLVARRNNAGCNYYSFSTGGGVTVCDQEAPPVQQCDVFGTCSIDCNATFSGHCDFLQQEQQVWGSSGCDPSAPCGPDDFNFNPYGTGCNFACSPPATTPTLTPEEAAAMAEAGCATLQECKEKLLAWVANKMGYLSSAQKQSLLSKIARDISSIGPYQRRLEWLVWFGKASKMNYGDVVIPGDLDSFYKSMTQPNPLLGAATSESVKYKMNNDADPFHSFPILIDFLAGAAQVGSGFDKRGTPQICVRMHGTVAANGGVYDGYYTWIIQNIPDPTITHRMFETPGNSPTAAYCTYM